MKPSTILRYVLIDKSNFDLAVKFQNEIFPNNDAYRNYYESVEGLRDASYYLVYLDQELLGIVGIYFEPVDLSSAWLGWFGVKKEYRRNGYGSLIMRFFESLAKEKGYKYARLFTDKYNNDIAISFYKSQGYKSEDYVNKDDPKSIEVPVLVFSKSLGKDICPSWNNRFINLTAQAEKENYRK